ncbi:MAG: hypothetical protein K8R53_04930 [Bacteroidales bacterium]|nr:hypothetical protein [Bacteroidales bacterium]
MIRKISISFVIFFAAMMLNFSALALQQRYDRREDDLENDPFVIELTDQHALKFLKNVWFFDLPVTGMTEEPRMYLVNDNIGIGVKYDFTFKTFTKSQLKFVLINYFGGLHDKIPSNTYVIRSV